MVRIRARGVKLLAVILGLATAATVTAADSKNKRIPTLPRVTAVIPPDYPSFYFDPSVMLDFHGGDSYRGLREDSEGETDSDQEEEECGETATASSVAPSRVGNPVVLSTGNKIEPELDFTSSGEMGLFLQRTYNHFWPGAGLSGKHWVSNFDYKLTFGSNLTVNSCYPRQGGGACGIGSNTIIHAWRPDGRVIQYIRNATDGIFYEDKPSAISRIVKQADGSFVLYGEDNELETYSSAGYVATVRNAQNIGWTFTYTGGTYPYRVTHTSGRYVELDCCRFSGHHPKLIAPVARTRRG